MRCISLVPSPMHSSGASRYKPLDVEFLRIAVGAVDAHGFDAVLERRFGGEVLRHAGFHVAALAAVEARAAASSVSSRAACARVAISPSFSWIA